ncbi:MAG: hypothetical protein P8X69_13495 [Maritimibacter sp.]
MSKVHRIAGLKIKRVEPVAAPHHKSLPDLEPPEERLRTEKTRIFSSDAITLSRAYTMEDVFEREAEEDRVDLPARLTVYTMNLTIMIFNLPVGLALLCMNIFGGVNLRTTAHVMALTGFFTVLAAANPGLLPI